MEVKCYRPRMQGPGVSRHSWLSANDYAKGVQMRGSSKLYKMNDQERGYGGGPHIRLRASEVPSFCSLNTGDRLVIHGASSSSIVQWLQRQGGSPWISSVQQEIAHLWLWCCEKLHVTGVLGMPVSKSGKYNDSTLLFIATEKSRTSLDRMYGQGGSMALWSKAETQVSGRNLWSPGDLADVFQDLAGTLPSRNVKLNYRPR